MLKTMRRIVQEVHAAETLQKALSIIVHRVREALETQACSVFLVDPDRDEFVLMATDGLNHDLVGRLRISTKKGLIGIIAQRGEPMNLDNAPEHPNFYFVPNVKEEGLKAFLGVPVVYHRRLLGVLVVQQEESRRYDEAEEAFLITISAQLGGVFAHAEVTTGVAQHATLLKPLKGIPSVPGIGIGQAVVVYPRADLDAIPDKTVEDLDREVARLEQALSEARNDIRLLSERMSKSLPPEEQALFDVYLKILDSNSWGHEIIALIRKGSWAEGALKKVTKTHLKQFDTMEDPYLKERAADIRDLAQRVLSHLQSSTEETVEYPKNTILIGEEVPASALAEIPRKRLVGIVSAAGSANSHIAILARAIGVPTVMGVERMPVSQTEQREVIVDGYQGQVYVSPSKALLKEFSQLEKEERELDENLEKLTDLPAETNDNYVINLCVNTGLMADVERSIGTKADGVGLFRTEVPFMIREHFPSEEVQRVIYRQLLGVFAPRPVTMRTLDIGGDKNLPYFSIKEPNPFLGWRGIRVTLDHPEVFLVQMRAMLKASIGFNNLRIMFPMITALSEFEEAMRLLKQAHHELIDEGNRVEFPPVGVMIEVPGAVYQARSFAQRVHFLSVGSNDLVQYLLAVDRSNARVSNLYDALHPAVLQALQRVVDGAHQENKSVSICGEMAGDPATVILLLAMGYDTLSMSATNLLRVKWVVRQFSMARAKQILSEVMTMDDASKIRKHLELALDDAGLGGLIRAGKS